MSPTLPVQTLSMGSHLIELVLQNKNPTITWNGKLYENLWSLVAELKELSDPIHIQSFALISNFFWKGTDYQLIDDIAAYQKEYGERVEYEKKHPADIFEYRLTDYKIFDVRYMHEPLVEDGQIIYFVFNLKNGLPYRVVAPFPYEQESAVVHYQILPILE